MTKSKHENQLRFEGVLLGAHTPNHPIPACLDGPRAREGKDLIQLPRLTPWDRTELRFGLRLAADTQNGDKTV